MTKRRSIVFITILFCLFSSLIHSMKYGLNDEVPYSVVSDAFNQIIKPSKQDIDVANSSPVIPFGLNAFTLLGKSSREVVMAGAFYGTGRAIGLGTDSLDKETTNRALKWLAQGSYSQSQVHQLRNVREHDLESFNFDSYKVLYSFDSIDKLSEKSLYNLAKYVYNGGGLLIGYKGWVLRDYRNFKKVRDSPLNHILGVFGIFITDRWLSGKASSTWAPDYKNSNPGFAAGYSKISYFQSQLIYPLLNDGDLGTITHSRSFWNLIKKVKGMETGDGAFLRLRDIDNVKNYHLKPYDPSPFDFSGEDKDNSDKDKDNQDTVVTSTGVNYRVPSNIVNEAFRKVISSRSQKTFSSDGTASTITPFGLNTFPLVQSTPSKVLVAGAVYGKGRVIGVGRGLRGDDEKKCLQWVTKDDNYRYQDIYRISRYTSATKLDNLDLSSYKAVSWWSDNRISKKSVENLLKHVKNGLGVCLGYKGWVWIVYSGYGSLQEVPMNWFLSEVGLAISDDYLEGDFSTTNQPNYKQSNAGYAAESSRISSEGYELIQKALHASSFDYVNQVSTLSKLLGRIDLEYLSFPIYRWENEKKLAALIINKEFNRLDKRRAAPGSDKFPGAVNNPQINTVRLNVNEQRVEPWVSTGRYLPPGGLLKVRVLSGNANKWKVRVGCHSDSIAGKDKWERYPVITVVGNMNEEITNANGGLVYLTTDSERTISVEISGTVETFFYDLTSANPVWNRRVSAPWGEIQGKYITISVPATAVTKLENAKEIAEFWDRIVLEDHKVRGTDHQIKRRERFVADIQISAGYMHAGYPIMTWLDVVTSNNPNVPPHEVNINTLKTSNSWGFYHEIGHNMQMGAWTFDGCGEVSNNIFSLLGGELAAGIKPWENSWLRNQFSNAKRFLRDNHNGESVETGYENLKKDVGVYLVQYGQLINAFGWEPFKNVFPQYVDNYLNPSENSKKIGQWYLLFSKAIRKDLRGFADLWRMPMDSRFSEQIKNLGYPGWLPTDEVAKAAQSSIDKMKRKYGI